MSQAPHYPSAPPESQQAQFTEQPDNATGLWAMILGILGVVVFGLLTAIPAIFLGISGRRKAAAGKATNDGQALAGLILGIVGTILSIIGAAFFVMMIMAARV